jgi:hypothetical protein
MLLSNDIDRLSSHVSCVHLIVSIFFLLLQVFHGIVLLKWYYAHIFIDKLTVIIMIVQQKILKHV